MNSESPQAPEPKSVPIVNESMDNFSESDKSEPQSPQPESFPDVWLDDSETSSQANLEQQSSTDKNPENSSAAEGDDWLETIIESSYPEESAVNPTPLESTEDEPELFTAQWLEESESVGEGGELNQQAEVTNIELQQLQQQKEALIAEIQLLEQQKDQMLSQQLRDVQETMGRMIEEGMRELKERKTTLQIEIDKLERRRERIRQEMRSNFAGVSQDLAIRVQGFKDYLVGSLQDLAAAAEQLELPDLQPKAPPQPRETRETREPRETRQPRQTPSTSPTSQPQFTEQAFAEQTRMIRKLLDQYRSRPDYYGPPWQLRRTFEPIHAERVQDWFFTQGGRGAIKSMGTRLQNILIAATVISVLHRLYGDRCVTLVLVNTPERLGEWRRGLQDCLGISRTDFGTSKGIVIFESPEVLAQRAERLIKDKLLPFIIIDETEDQISLALLRFPLWLAFAPEPQSTSNNYLY